MFDRTDHALLAVGIEIVPALFLAECGLCRNAAGSRAEERLDGLAVRAGDVPAIDCITDGGCMNGRAVAPDETAAIEFAEDAHDAAGTVDVLHVDVVLRRRDLGQARHVARQAVDVVHREVDPALIGRGEDVEHRVGRSAHRDVERHCVLERLLVGDRTRQHALVVLLVIALAQIDDQMAGFDE